MPDGSKHSFERSLPLEDARRCVVRIIDFFCGIGGVAEATRGLAFGVAGKTVSARVVTAIDIDERLGAIYEANHGVRTTIRAIESLCQIPEVQILQVGNSAIGMPKTDLATPNAAEMWWMSPPCQPYTRRGAQRAEMDSRSAGLEQLVSLVDQQRPEFIGLENVPAFDGSVHHHRLSQLLQSLGYGLNTYHLCPTEWGVPMRRRRFYLLARRDGGAPQSVEKTVMPRELSSYLDPHSWDDRSLRVDSEILDRYAKAMNIVNVEDSLGMASCFTSAYGSSPVRAGAYLYCKKRELIRRFSPAEIARLMGFRNGFLWPTHLCQRDQYRLLGNSLAVMVVRDLLKTLLSDR